MSTILGAVFAITAGSAVVGWVDNYVRYVRPAKQAVRRAR